MKRRLFLPLSIIPLLGLVVPFVFGSGETKSVHAYSVASLPTTIDLNDTDAATIRSYYSDLDSLPASERTGTNLLKNLKPILKSGQKYYSYDVNNGRPIWQMYEITDRDWEKSPAGSDTYGTYNSLTNTITDYVYGTSSSSSKNNPYIHALYVNRDVDNEVRAWDDHQQTQWGINREHVWPKSAGFDLEGTGGARGDPMHLMAGNGRVNGTEHNNYVYGYVDPNKIDSEPSYSNLKGNLRGTSLTLGYGTVFEPQDCDKGDIARACFYMVARYNYLSGSDPDGIDQDNPNLQLAETTDRPSAFTSSESEAGTLGLISDLLEWNRIDPPDEFEIHRNNLLYTNFTNNRNPFIDFPEWADYIWGSYAGSKSADPTTDEINGGSVVPTGSVSISTTSIEIDIGETTTISANSSDNSDITWSIDDSSIASFSKNPSSSGESITITGLSNGTTTITASATIDNVTYSKTCSITVNIPIVSVTGISLDIDSASLEVGSTLQLHATVLPSNATNQNVTWTSSRNTYATVTQDGLVTAIKTGRTVTITARTEDGGYTATCSITPVNAAIHVTGVTLSETSLSLEKGTSETLTATISPSNATNKNISWSTSNEDIVTVADGVVTAVGDGDATITVTSEDGGYTASCSVNVYTPSVIPSTSDSVILTFSELGYENAETVPSVTFYDKNSQTIVGTFGAGTNKNPPKYYDYGSSIRMYGANTLTITSSLANLTKIEFTFGEGDSSYTNEITFSSGSYSDGVWTTSSLVNEVTLTIGGTTGQRRFASIEVFYFGANSFSDYFLGALACDSTGNTTPSGESWSTIESKYDLMFIEDKTMLLNITSDESGEIIERAMARYDYIVAKYGISQYKDFISRNPSLHLNHDYSSDENASIVVVTIVSISSLTIVGLCVIIKKAKKHY